MKKVLSKKLCLLFSMILLILFLGFTLWWYGLFDDFGKTGEMFDSSSIDFLDTGEIAVYGMPDPNEQWRKGIAGMTTENVIKDFLACTPTAISQGIYNMPRSFSRLYQPEDYRPFHSPGPFTEYVDILLKRNNAAVILLHYYEEMSTEGIYGNKEAFGCFELILAQPRFQRHLTPEDRARIPEIVKQKQLEKFADPDYSSHQYYNFLYTDAYSVDEEGWIHWDEEKLKEYAKPFAYLAEIEDSKELEAELQQFKTQQKKERCQESLNTSRQNLSQRLSFRFDSCG